VMEARGEEITLRIEGEGRGVDTTFDSIAPESACTSMQLHLQVPPEQFAAAWNAAQAIAGPQVALAANSPFLLGRRLWHETRIPTFVQALDTRPPEYAAQGVRPRVWFGERWITSMFDLFEENVRLFPALIPESREMAEEPLLTEGHSPRLHELMLHNGTVWRWNRPIYDTVDGTAPGLVRTIRSSEPVSTVPPTSHDSALAGRHGAAAKPDRSSSARLTDSVAPTSGAVRPSTTPVSFCTPPLPWRSSTLSSDDSGDPAEPSTVRRGDAAGTIWRESAVFLPIARKSPLHTRTVSPGSGVTSA